MADNVQASATTGSGPTFAADEELVTLIKHPYGKMEWGLGDQFIKVDRVTNIPAADGNGNIVGSGPLPVQFTNRVASGTLSASGHNVEVDSEGASVVYWEIDGGTLAGVSVGFDGTLDGSNWFTLRSIALDGTISTSITKLSGVALRGAITSSGYKKVRIIVSGSATGTSGARVAASFGQDTVRIAESLPAGANSIGSVVVSTLPSLPAGAAAIGSVTVTSVTPGTGITNLGKAHQSVFAPTTHVGVLSLGVRHDDETVLASNDQYHALLTDAAGGLKVGGSSRTSQPFVGNPVVIGGRGSAGVPTTAGGSSFAGLADGDSVPIWANLQGAVSSRLVTDAGVSCMNSGGSLNVNLASGGVQAVANNAPLTADAMLLAASDGTNSHFLRTSATAPVGNEQGLIVRTIPGSAVQPISDGGSSITVDIDSIAAHTTTTPSNGLISSQTPGINTVMLPVQGYGAVGIQINTGQGAVIFEASVNGTDFVALQVWPSNSATPVTTASTSGSAFAGLWYGPCGGFLQVRVRCTTYTSGPITVAMRAMPSGAKALSSSTGGTAQQDNVGFTAGSGSLTPAGGVYYSGRSVLSDGNAGAVALNARRGQYVTLEDQNSNLLLNQQLMVSSIPVVLASNHTNVPVSFSTGATGAGKVGATVAAATDVGMAVFGVRDDQLADLSIVDDTEYGLLRINQRGSLWVCTDGARHNDPLVANIPPHLMGAYASAAAPTAVSTDGDAVNLWADLTGKLQVTAHPGPGIFGVGGSAANGAAMGAQPPVPVGLRISAGSANTDALGAEVEGDVMFGMADTLGKQITLPYSKPENMVYGVTAAITGTAATQVLASAGSGRRNYITSLMVTNSHATTSTLVEIRDGTSTVMWRGYALAAGGGFSITFPTPLRGSAATAVNAYNITDVSNTYVSIAGYTAV